MCGIVGYIGSKEAQEILLKGLERLEYRGYDSAGLATVHKNKLYITKRQGKLKTLVKTLHAAPLHGSQGLGHTRWATHGVPNETNAHPHVDCTGEISVVHNGIIENYQELRRTLIKEGHTFTSDTDTEVIPHLIEKYYKGDLEEAVRKTARVLKGAYAIAVTHSQDNEQIVGARCNSPLVVGLGKDENFIASDVPAILDYTKSVIYLNNFEVVSIRRDGVVVTDLYGRTVMKKPSRITWDISQAEKGGFSHFMLKEIFEQGAIIKKMFSARINKNIIHFDGLQIKPNRLKKFEKIAIVACGTAYHAGLAGQYALEQLTRIPCFVDTSSEFRYRDPVVDKETLVVVVSQSGETADTLAAVREAKRKGAAVLAICNAVGSSIARECDGVIYTYAGPEIAVASTKAYTAQLAIFYLFALYLAKLRHTITATKYNSLLRELKKLPHLLERLLSVYRSRKNPIAKYADDFEKYYHKKHHKSCFLYLARNINYASALEGALKLKEISYISAEGYPAGEMKHGPIALIDENPWVVCIAVASKIYDKMISNIQEIKSRGGIIIAVVTEGDKEILENKVRYHIEVPKIDEIFSPILVAVPLQLLAYYVALEFGEDIDQPRNLAKSVTVE
ncbi:MAG: glutamine--fructose-6-phosphate transaminase (isomerizing) [Candidatus Omnitrophota bacterium]